MTEHLPALQVVLPLFGALIAALVRRPLAAWLVTLVVSVACLVVAVLLFQRVLSDGVISYRLGGWDPSLGIEYRVDIVNALILVLVTAVAAVVAPFARLSVGSEIPEDKVAWFYTMYLVAMAGLLGIAITGDAFNAFVFLEVSSLSSYALIAMGRDRRALVAAYQYLIVGTIGASFYVIGVGLLYMMTGTLNLVLIAERIGDVETIRPVLAALAFIVVGISLKLALFPLHVWLPNAYAYAPSVATVFLAATATKVAIYLFARYVYSVFGAELRLRRPAARRRPARLLDRRDLRCRDRRRLPVRPEADVRLFVGRAGRLHHPRPVARAPSPASPAASSISSITPSSRARSSWASARSSSAPARSSSTTSPASARRCR